MQVQGMEMHAKNLDTGATNRYSVNTWKNVDTIVRHELVTVGTKEPIAANEADLFTLGAFEAVCGVYTVVINRIEFRLTEGNGIITLGFKY